MPQDFLLRFFSWSSSPPPLKIALGSFQSFLKILRDIRHYSQLKVLYRYQRHLPPLSTTPMANLPPVSMTPVVNFLLVMVPLVLLTPVVNLPPWAAKCEYLREFSKKIQNGPNGILGTQGLRETASWKKLTSKISRHCPFNVTSFILLSKSFCLWRSVFSLFSLSSLWIGIEKFLCFPKADTSQTVPQRAKYFQSSVGIIFPSLHKNGLKRPVRLMSSSKTPLFPSLSLCLNDFYFLFFYIRNSFRLSTRRRRWRIAEPPSVSAARTGSSLLSRKLSAASSTRRGQTGTVTTSGADPDPGSGMVSFWPLDPGSGMGKL